LCISPSDFHFNTNLPRTTVGDWPLHRATPRCLQRIDAPIGRDVKRRVRVHRIKCRVFCTSCFPIMAILSRCWLLLILSSVVMALPYKDPHLKRAPGISDTKKENKFKITGFCNAVDVLEVIGILNAQHVRPFCDTFLGIQTQVVTRTFIQTSTSTTFAVTTATFTTTTRTTTTPITFAPPFFVFNVFSTTTATTTCPPVGCNYVPPMRQIKMVKRIVLFERALTLPGCTQPNDELSNPFA